MVSFRPMTRIDQFESVFRSATRTPFEYRSIRPRRVLLVSDLEAKDASLFADRVRGMLAAFEGAKGTGGAPEREGEREMTWVSAAADRGRTVGELLEVVEAEQPDLICAYRSLYSEGWRWPFSLGEHLDVLTQATTTPVLVLPRPDREAFWGRDDLGTHSVMAITDHLEGDSELVCWAVASAARDGVLCLAHIEDEAIFERYIDGVIAKIPSIETETARQAMAQQLFKDPTDYIATCKTELRRHDLPLRLEKVVTFGHQLETVKKLVAERGVDLLVLHTKDADQLAMHGLAYPIAIELRETPLLML